MDDPRSLRIQATNHVDRRRHRRRQLENKIKVGDDHHDEQESPVAEAVCHDFWNQAPSDVLWEIFIRLPDCRSVVRSSAVCRSWHSFILDNPRFIPSFKSHHHQHQERYPPLIPYTILLTNFQHIYHMFSEEWNFLHDNKLPDFNLNFLPKYSPLAIRASCNDLLLVSSPDSRHVVSNDNYVCNPMITKQFVHLPASPKVLPDNRNYNGWVGYGLLCMQGEKTDNNPFKVVEVFIRPSHQESIIPVFTFCSESRKWESRSFPCLQPTAKSYGFTWNSVSVVCKGVLYWLHQYEMFSCVAFYTDLFREQCGFLDLPPSDLYQRDQLGAVRVSGGEVELRLVQLSIVCLPGKVNVKVWRLMNDNCWVLVHSKWLKRPKNFGRRLHSHKDQHYVSPYVHPTNGDLVFVLWGRKVFEYNLIDGTCKLIYDLPQDIRCARELTPFPLFLP